MGAWIGWVLLQFVGAAVVFVGLALVVRPAFQETSHATTLTLGDRQFSSTHVGIVVLAFGLIFSLAVFLLVKPAESTKSAANTDFSSIPQTVVTVTQPAQTLEPDSDASGSPIPPTASDPPISQSPTAACGSPSGPWVGDANGLQIVVSDVTPDSSLGGRLQFTLRIENRSRDSVSIDSSKILAIDSNGKQYGVDERSLDWVSVESDEFEAATIVLETPLQGSPGNIQLRFNVTSLFLDYWTVEVCVPVAALG